jgi:hypothetical protein
MDDALSGLVALRLERLEITRAWALVLVLEGDRWIEVEAGLREPDQAPDDPPYWEVFRPDSSLVTLGPGPWWRIASSHDVESASEVARHEPPDQGEPPRRGTGSFAGRDLSDLLALWTDLTRELEKRGAIRRSANLLDDMAEELVRLRFDGFRGSYERSGWDVLTKDGKRLEVKAIKGDRPLGRRLMVGRGDYDALVVVAFTDQLLVPMAWRIPREVVQRHQSLAKTQETRSFVRLTRTLLDDPLVEQLDLSRAPRR